MAAALRVGPLVRVAIRAAGGTSTTEKVVPEARATVLAADHPSGLASVAFQILVAILILLAVAAPPTLIRRRRARRQSR